MFQVFVSCFCLNLVAMGLPCLGVRAFPLRHIFCQVSPFSTCLASVTFLPAIVFLCVWLAQLWHSAPVNTALMSIGCGDC